MRLKNDMDGKMVNINRKQNDAFYRYKMPSLMVSVLGNGRKTVLHNLDLIGKSLNRPPVYILKYFGYEIGTQTQFDAKNTRYTINGVHSSDELIRILDKFILKYVLCPECENPETELSLKRKSILVGVKNFSKTKQKLKPSLIYLLPKFCETKHWVDY